MPYKSRHTLHKVVALALPGVVAFDLSTAAQIFGYRGEAEYSFTLCSGSGGEVATSTGFSIAQSQTLDVLADADTIVVPGFVESVRDPSLGGVLEKLRDAGERGTRIVSICTGAFALAEAGLLDGLCATTHWQFAEDLRRNYPLIDVDPKALYVDNDSVATSAGVAAGIDLCLHLVRKDFGQRVAGRIAKRMVVAPHREGGQAQFIDGGESLESDGLAPVTEWMVTNLAEPLKISDCAEYAGLSLRHFQRRFVDEIGVAPAAWLNRQRVLFARTLLEQSDEGMDAIAERSGLVSGANLRRRMRSEIGVTPSSYRRSFRGVQLNVRQ